ncbi:2-oxo acid dehydrogenase subunit E2 [Candidatus Woesearchaeota archaeon]|nr:2-oxo acid dehydrogenase subunit E2 [Candidatus Woesearchaeota archaeon]
MEFKLPDLGEGLVEGNLIKWLVKEGDVVKKDQPVVEMETDKAVVDIPVPVAGTIEKLLAKEQQTVKVGEVIFTIKTDEIIPEKDTDQGIVGKTEAGAEEISIRREPQKTAATSQALATPAVRRLARNLDIDLSTIKGSGKDGRITEEDLKGEKTQETGEIERIPLKGIRKSISDAMTNSLHKLAQATHFDRADVTKLVALREQKKKQGKSMTYLPYFVKTVLQLLKKYPTFNASMEGEEIVLKKFYNMGIAVNTEHGLLVPNIKDADKRSLQELADDIAQLAKNARDRKLTREDMKNGTFTITNIGSLGGIYYTPIINYPESAILAIGKLQDEPIVREGKVEIRKIAHLSLTYDHRLIDGAEAQLFLNEIIGQLESPASLDE